VTDVDLPNPWLCFARHHFNHDVVNMVAFPRNYSVRLQHISEALIACGYTKLDQQSKALGIRRSTAWTIMKTKHKLGRLSTKTTNRILANPQLPLSVRSVVQRYMAERSDALARRAKQLGGPAKPGSPHDTVIHGRCTHVHDER
jgi:hypothetical protein